MHVESVAVYGIAGLKPEIRGSFDVQGDSYAGSEEFVPGIAEGWTTEYIRANGSDYEKPPFRGGDASEWGYSSKPPAPDPFAGLNSADVTVAPANRLELIKIMPVYLSAFRNVVGLDLVEPSAMSFDVIVDAAGTPLSAQLSLDGQLSGPDISGPLAATIDYTFSRWGAGFTIEAPKVAATTDPGDPDSAFTLYNRYDEAVVARDDAGHALTVEGCSQNSTAEWDGFHFEVAFVGDGARIERFDSDFDQPFTHVVVSASLISAMSGPPSPEQMPVCGPRE